MCATEHLQGVTPDEADCLGLDERRQSDELLRAAQEVPGNYKDLTSQPGPPPPVEVPTEPRREPEQLSHDDLEIGMDAVEQMPPLEGAAETASSTEVGGQSSSWRGHGASLGQQALSEIPYGETAGSPQFKKGSSGGPLEDEHERTGEDETELIGPENILIDEES